MTRRNSSPVIPWLVALGLASCAATPPPEPGTRVYSKGILRTTVETPLKEVIPATLQALKKLQLRPVERERDAFTSVIVGDVAFGNSESSELHVHLSRLTEETTEISIRILFRRDQQKLEQILDEILKGLEAAQPE